jgi:hypothetical protein
MPKVGNDGDDQMLEDVGQDITREITVAFKRCF